MGIVNVNDDSFSGDGTTDAAAAIAYAAKQAQLGADMIDIGAESARTNREAISVEEEIRRLRGFLDRWQDAVESIQPVDDGQVWPPVVSINTWRSEVVEAVLEFPLEVELINDMGGLPSSENARLAADAGAALLVMHTVGLPKIPQTGQRWGDIIAELVRFFAEKIKQCREAGLRTEQVVLDPGVDFAKQREDNLILLRELDRLQQFNRPLLLPASRKTVIGDVLGLEEPSDRDPGTMALVAAGVMRGAQIYRVHHVEATWQALRVLWGIQSRAPCLKRNTGAS